MKTAAMTALDAAKAYTKRGWSVIPLLHKDKKPAGRWEEFQHRLPTAEELQTFRNGRKNLGIVTGEISGLLVIDVDVDPSKQLNGGKALGELEGKYGALPKTVQVATPRGGRHLYFRYLQGYDVRNSAGILGEGLDVRGNFGYVVGVPSILPNGNYEFVPGHSFEEIGLAAPPDWLLKLLTQKQHKTSPSTSNGNGNGTIPQGRRNAHFTSLAGTMRRKGCDQPAIEKALLEENAAKCNPPLPEDEIQSIAASVCRYEPSEATPSAEGGKLAETLQNIESLLLRFVEFETPGLATLLALWVVQTYAIEYFNFCGFVSLQSSTPRCGKTRLLELLALLAADSPTVTTFPSAAVLFRSKRRVIVLDEVDGLRNKDKEAHGDLMSILNCAFKRGSVVERVAKTKEGFTVEAHNAYRAIALAGLEKLSDALTDRAFIIRLKRAAHRMPRLNTRTLEPVAEKIKAQAEGWMTNNVDEIHEIYSTLEDETAELKGRDDRLQDIAEPLLTLALLADAETPGAGITDSFMKAIEAVDGRREKSNREEQLLNFLEIAKTHLNKSSEVFVESATLVQNCGKSDSLGWIETTKKLSNFLKNFDLSPFSQSGKVRGYTLTSEWVKEWEVRYR